MSTQHKFDVIIGNPPYKSGLHLKFLKLAFNLSNRYVIWIAPSGNYIDEKNINKSYSNINNLIENSLSEVTILNANELFNVGLFLPLAISVIDKQNTSSFITIHSKINNKSISVNNIKDINKWLDYVTYPSLKEIIQIFANQDNILNHINKYNGNYYINVPIIRGHPECDDFYTFFPRNYKYELSINGGNSGKVIHYLSFKTEDEVNNCINYLKTNFARFCLSIFKINHHLDSKELIIVPWLDFTQEWTDNKLYKYFELTEDEIIFIETNIPKYY